MTSELPTNSPTDLPTNKPAKARSRKTSAKSAAATPPAEADGTPDWSYEEAVAEIEAIVAQMEAGDLDLATVFARFEAAMGQLRRCKAFLQDKQSQVDLILETLEEDVRF